MKQEEFVSLYDFLGKAAGSKLGKEVYRAAQLASQPTVIKHVDNPAYTGKIVMYKPEFPYKGNQVIISSGRVTNHSYDDFIFIDTLARGN